MEAIEAFQPIEDFRYLDQIDLQTHLQLLKNRQIKQTAIYFSAGWYFYFLVLEEMALSMLQQLEGAQ